MASKFLHFFKCKSSVKILSHLRVCRKSMHAWCLCTEGETEKYACYINIYFRKATDMFCTRNGDASILYSNKHSQILSFHAFSIYFFFFPYFISRLRIILSKAPSRSLARFVMADSRSPNPLLPGSDNFLTFASFSAFLASFS